MKTDVANPVIRKIKDNEVALTEFEKETLTGETEKVQEIIRNFPTVYIHNWPETDKYDVKYQDGKIVYDPKETKHSKVTMRKTLSDGSMQNFAEELLKHEVRVLMTRGVNGLYIYICTGQTVTGSIVRGNEKIRNEEQNK